MWHGTWPWPISPPGHMAEHGGHPRTELAGQGSVRATRCWLQEWTWRRRKRGAIHCSERSGQVRDWRYFILVRPRRPRCDDACRAKLCVCAPHQTVTSCFAAQTEHELAWLVQSAFRVLASPSAFCAGYPPPLHLPARTALHRTIARADDDCWARVRCAMAVLVMRAARCRQEGCDWRGPGSCPWLARFPEPAPSRGKMDHGRVMDGILANVDRACGKPSSHCDRAREMQCVKSAWLSAQRSQKSCPVMVEKALTSRLFSN